MIRAALRQVREARDRAASDGWASSTSDATSEFALDGAADALAGYRLERVLHRGGQGVVYRGVQLSTGRTVAVKLLSRGAFSSRNEQLRFEREVHVLGQLEAPGIVRIVDSGVAAGHWWFTMDFIDGLPLDEFVRARLHESPTSGELSHASRARLLAIFADVAEAVNAAHLHGVIHRDLKPRNILVDDSGRAHVLDFGLAKLDGPLSGDSLEQTMTETGQFVGSLPWASPEQALGQAAVDLRTDVYSLGVILYQVLTGRFPYSVVGRPRDVVDRILSHEPEAPSTLSPGINDELQTIVLKCLSKESERRYQSAGDLARDLRHYLAGEPIEAKRDSLGYVVGKSLRRHRVAAGVAAAFVVLIAGASVTSLVLWRMAVGQRDRAIEAEQAQTGLRLRAEAEADKATQTNQFLQSVIRAADPRVAQGRDLTVRQMMEDAVHQLDSGQLGHEPEIEAAVRFSVGEAYLALGRFDDAGRQAQQALESRRSLFGSRHRDVAESLKQLSEIRGRQGRRAESTDLAREALEIVQRLHEGRDHLDVVHCLQRLAWASVGSSRLGEGAAYMAQAVAMLQRLYGPDDVRTLQSQVDQTVMSHDIAGSEEILRRAIERFREQFGPHHHDVLATTNMLGGLLQMKGDLDGAEGLYREALELTHTIYGRAHPLSIEGLMLVARLERRRGEHARAASMLAESLETARQAYGEGSFGLAQYLNQLGGHQWQSGAVDDGERSFSEGLAMLRALGRDQDVDAAKAKVALCRIQVDRNELDQAELLAHACLAASTQILPQDHWIRATASSLLGTIRSRQGAFEEADALLLTGYRSLEHQSGLGPGLKADAMRGLIEHYQAWERAHPEAGKRSEVDAWEARLRAQIPPRD